MENIQEINDKKYKQRKHTEYNDYRDFKLNAEKLLLKPSQLWLSSLF